MPTARKCSALSPPLPPTATPAREAVKLLNWTVIALSAAIIFLDVGFLMLYRSGFDVSLGQLVTQSAAALLLLGLGVVLFRERLNLANHFLQIIC